MSFFSWPVYLLIGFAVIGILYLLYRRYRKWNEGWLSNQIEAKLAELEKNRKNKQVKILFLESESKGYYFSTKVWLLKCYFNTLRSFGRKAPRDIYQLDLPAKKEAILIFLAFLLFFIISHIDVPCHQLTSLLGWYNFLSKQVSIDTKLSSIYFVLGGLVTIVFALIFFIAESIRKSADQDEKRLFLKKSHLWVLIIITVLMLINFLYFDVRVVSLLLPILLSVLVLFSFWQVIHLLMDPRKRNYYKAKFFKKRTRAIVLDFVRERLGNYILRKEWSEFHGVNLESKFIIMMDNSNTDKYFFIENEDSGRLTDINISRLNKVIRYIKEAFLAHGLDDTSKSDMEYIDPLEDLTTVSPDKKNIYLCIRYEEETHPLSSFNNNRNALFALPNELANDKKLIARIQNSIPFIFKFEKTERSSIVFRRELLLIKDQFVLAIHSEMSGSIEEFKNTYLGLAEIFLDTIHQLGSGYTAEQAKKERGDLFEGWDIVSWLDRDIRELMEVAAKSDNRDVIADVMYLPIAIATRAILAKDHLLFQQFIVFPAFLYYMTKDKSNNEAKAFMIDRSWRHLSELLELHIQPILEDHSENTSQEEIKENEEFIWPIFNTFQKILKSCIDDKDFDSFKIILDEFNGLFKYFYPKGKYGSQIQHHIFTARNQILFGLSSWIFSRFHKHPDNEEIKPFFEYIISRVPFAIDIKTLTEVYISVRSEGASSRWGWMFWEMEGKRGARILTFENNFHYLYCILALRILDNLTDDRILNTSLPLNRQLAIMPDQDPQQHSLYKKLVEMGTHPEQWAFVLTEEQCKKSTALIKRLELLGLEQKRSDEEKLTSYAIDPKKLKSFIDDVQRTFNESGDLLKVFKLVGKQQDLTNEPPPSDIYSYGYNDMGPKEAFIPDWYIDHSLWGGQYGPGLARTMDYQIFESMIDGTVSENRKAILPKELLNEISESLNEIVPKTPVIIHSLDFSVYYRYLLDADSFFGKNNEDCPKTKFDGIGAYEGVLKIGNKSIPTIRVLVGESELDNKLLLADLSRYGILKQYSPVEDSKDQEHKHGPLFIRVTDLNADDERRKKILNKQPDWLNEYKDKEGYLRQKVVIEVYQKSKFEITDPNAAICFSISIPDEDIDEDPEE